MQGSKSPLISISFSGEGQGAVCVNYLTTGSAVVIESSDMLCSSELGSPGSSCPSSPHSALALLLQGGYSAWTVLFMLFMAK